MWDTDIKDDRKKLNRMTREAKNKFKKINKMKVLFWKTMMKRTSK